MGDQQSLQKQLGASPKKLALIGALAALLIGVLYVQYWTSSDPKPEDSAITARTARRPPRPKDGPAAVTPVAQTADGNAAEWLIESVDRRQWKPPALAEVVRYDPFALPAAFPQPIVADGPGSTLPDGTVIAADSTMDEDQRAEAIADVESKLADLQQRGVRVIVQGRKQAAAVIGDRTVHVGDDVDGFTVKAISADGVVVERKLEQ